jgi:hypothetical protein
MSTDADTFLDDAELRTLTGRATRKGQIAALRTLQPPVPFWVNALGKPVVARAAIIGQPTAPKAEAANQPWKPRLGGAA